MNTAFQPSGNEVKQAAFNEHRRSGKLSSSRGVVITTLASQGPMTRNQLATATALPLASICGRCRELLDLGYIDVAGMSADSPARQVLQLTGSGKGLVLEASEIAGEKRGEG
ncbi:MarR family winged helix-turn-helix transcriptional regulator [Vreelandella janggokensis]|uniref:MarR family winged helix-turn-helix transcriptional regulator n=1 Tax=Vreelandella janggokensis TaxID=370767 RepID=UPI0028613C32|nr:MarR family winged helix-turn-helix transcriptional regulator [Halomonas janggokensis]MDR5887541.1 MarR family winged helix-turn-helix transcriptional regulator [Halomonas janggokensis]